MFSTQQQASETRRHAWSMPWLPAELIDTVWEFRADPRCNKARALDGRRFPAEEAPPLTEMGCEGRRCCCGFRLVL